MDAIAPNRPRLFTCPDCGFTDSDVERVYAHLWTCPKKDPSVDGRRTPRKVPA